MIQRIVVVNPPYFIGIIWKVVKFLLKEKQQKILYFNKGTSLFELVDRDVVPVAFGGNRKVGLFYEPLNLPFVRTHSGRTATIVATRRN